MCAGTVAQHRAVMRDARAASPPDFHRRSWSSTRSTAAPLEGLRLADCDRRFGIPTDPGARAVRSAYPPAARREPPRVTLPAHGRLRASRSPSARRSSVVSARWTAALRPLRRSLFVCRRCRLHPKLDSPIVRLRLAYTGRAGQTRNVLHRRRRFSPLNGATRISVDRGSEVSSPAPPRACAS